MIKFPASNKAKSKDLTSGVLAPILNRLSEIIFRRYNCELYYASLNDSTPSEVELVKSLCHGRQPVRLNDKVFFPVFVDNDLHGAGVIIEEDGPFSRETLKLMHAVICLVIESALTTANTLEVLNSMEERLSTVDGPDNVIALTRSRPRDGHPRLPRRDVRRKIQSNIPILLEGRGHDDIFKMAFEIHESSDRYAFVHIDEISLQSVEDFESLGSITLFIPDIARLTKSQQQLINDYLESGLGPFKPQIIAGTVYGKNELLNNDHLINNQLVERLSACHLQMKLSFRCYQELGVVHFFQDALDGLR